MIVVDASVLLDWLLGKGSPAGDALAELLRSGEILCAPHLVDAEVGQGLRRYALSGDLSGTEATEMIADFLDLPIRRYPHDGLLAAAFAYRSNATVYDALYLTLAEALDCPFLTGDASLQSVPGSQASVRVATTSA